MSKIKVLWVALAAVSCTVFSGILHAACNSENDVQYAMEISIGAQDYYRASQDAEITATVNITPVDAGATNASISWSGIVSGSTNVNIGEPVTITFPASVMTPSSTTNDKSIFFTATNSSDDYEDPDDPEDDGLCWATNSHTFTVVKVDIEQTNEFKCVSMTNATLTLTADSYSPGGYDWTSPSGLDGSGSGSTFTYNPSNSTPGTYTVECTSSNLSSCSDTCTVNIIKVEILNSGDTDSDDCLSPPSGGYLYWKTTPTIGSASDYIGTLKVRNSGGEEIFSMGSQLQTGERFWYGTDNDNNTVTAGTYYAWVEIDTGDGVCHSEEHELLVFYVRLVSPSNDYSSVNEMVSCVAEVNPSGTTGTWSWKRTLGLGGTDSTDGFADPSQQNTTFTKAMPDDDSYGDIWVVLERPSGGSYGDGTESALDTKPLVVLKLDIDPEMTNVCSKLTNVVLSLTDDSFLGSYYYNTANWSSEPAGISGSGSNITFNPSEITATQYIVTAVSSEYSGCSDTCTVDVIKVDIEPESTNVCANMTNVPLNLTTDSYWDGGGVTWTSTPSGLGGVSFTDNQFTFNPSNELGPHC